MRRMMTASSTYMPGPMGIMTADLRCRHRRRTMLLCLLKANMRGTRHTLHRPPMAGTHSGCRCARRARANTRASLIITGRSRIRGTRELRSS